MQADLLTVVQLTWWLVAFTTVLLTFIKIQRFLNDPRRKQFNAEWFARFEAALKGRYQADGIDWRREDLGLHFGHQDTGQRTLDAWYAYRMSVLPPI